MRIAVSCCIAFLMLGCEPQRQTNSTPLPGENSMSSTVKKLSEQSSRYQASTEDWGDFLSCWAKQMDQSLVPSKSTLDANLLRKINGQQLPKSYLDFVAATNGKGWLLPGDKKRYNDNVLQFFALNDVGLFKLKDRVTWKAWADNPTGRKVENKLYYDYTIKQNLGLFRDEDLNSLVIVGDLGHGAILVLNPKEKTLDGEWEAWYFSTKLAGASRYRSFAELMQLVYFFDIDPAKDSSLINAEFFKPTCAGKIFQHFRLP